MRPRILIALLLAACATLRAADEAAPMGTLMFSTDKNPGKGGIAITKLSASGTYLLYGNPHTIRGSLTAHESQRIFEEFEKLCLAAGAERFLPDPRRGNQPVAPPFIFFESPRVKMLAGPEKPLPPEMTQFLVTLRQKLLYHASKHPAAPSPTPGKAPAP